jgi:NAD(P)-dependent dehydrogenase (short-subunit alcohol dehydrogenase family)
LTNLLRPHLEKSSSARVVNVASDAHKGTSINFEDLEGKKKYSGWQAYKQSKLANILFTNELARRVDASRLTVNSLHPGFVRTNFLQVFEGRWGGRLLRAIAERIAIPPEQGARTSIYLASSPEVAGVNGRYFVKEKPVPSSPQSLDLATGEKLWRVSEAMCGLGGMG